MYQDSERHSGATWCLPGDPRVTPVGRVLRFTHLDELPQLINVLLGEMSLVGPRPERPEFLPKLERALPDYRRRLAVRPGVTGLAQVQQPPDTDLLSVRRKLNYDLYYVGPHQSLARPPDRARHGPQVRGRPLRLDRPAAAAARSQRDAPSPKPDPQTIAYKTLVAETHVASLVSRRCC